MSSNQRTETSFRKQQNKLFESFILFFFFEHVKYWNALNQISSEQIQFRHL